VQKFQLLQEKHQQNNQKKKTDAPVNNEQEQIPPANMEFINI